ncbi:PP2C family protein-serine/threonine phosphatase [Cellulosimicrobium cellulans]|uniref:PP2C family protein-serine/threonine phosphatase n=1 Tax=Cellulosimicrobium cellulans TaxID=1710 RepID=UPI0008489EFC|nr:SpoIIE family protein phosphatase [Cellulosimicrobium cellulans]
MEAAQERGDGTAREPAGPTGKVDYHAVFAALTAPKLVLSPELMILDANEAFLRTVDAPATAVVGRHYLDVFAPREDVGPLVRQVAESFDRVLATGRLEMIGPQRYDMRDAEGRWSERWWIMTNVPVLDPAGRVSLLVHRAEDVTDIVLARRRIRADRPAPAGPAPGTAGTDAPRPGSAETPPAAGAEDTDAGSGLDQGVLGHVLAVGSTVRRYADVLVRERRAALELQDSILTPPPSPPGLRIDARYRPAVPEVHVGGDWYDAFVQRDGRTVAVVGDVTGHDVSAAARMGHLRGIVRAIGYNAGCAPARLLDEAEETAAGLELEVSATVVVACVDSGAPGTPRAVTWTRAGHPPPVLLRADGSAHLLQAKADPPLGLGLGGNRHDHAATLAPGDTLLLYTDGLIERRDRRLRESLAVLPERVAVLARVGPGRLLDALLTDLVPDGAEDDVALLSVHVKEA